MDLRFMYKVLNKKAENNPLVRINLSEDNNQISINYNQHGTGLRDFEFIRIQNLENRNSEIDYQVYNGNLCKTLSEDYSEHWKESEILEKIQKNCIGHRPNTSKHKRFIETSNKESVQQAAMKIIDIFNQRSLGR